jgi:hypothetical protein
MDHIDKPEPGHATFSDGSTAVRLSFPAEDAPAWRSATAKAIVGHLGFAIRTAPVEWRPNGTDAARYEP